MPLYIIWNNVIGQKINGTLVRIRFDASHDNCLVCVAMKFGDYTTVL